MKKKKGIIIITTILCFIVVLSVFATSFNKRNSIEKLMSELGEAINDCNRKKIINLYPKYYSDTISNWISQDKINDFNSKIGDINIEITGITEYNTTKIFKDVQEEIYDDYKINVNIEDYQIVITDVKNDSGIVFGETQFEVIKVNGNYYLYARSYTGDLIQCFLK